MSRRNSPSRIFVSTLCIALTIASLDAAAQGFPGGGGGRGGHGGMRPPDGASRSNPPADQAPPPSPIATFLSGARALRAEILVRDDQVERWTAMQDALRSYVDVEQDYMRSLHNAAPADPLLRLHNLAGSARDRADAMQKVSESIDAVAAVLDDRQRQVFANRLADAFAGAAPRSP